MVLLSFLTSTLLAGELPTTFPSKFDSRLHFMGTQSELAGLATMQDAGSTGEIPGKKSAGLAALYSLVLPGMGELYAEGFSSGKYFLLAEGRCG
jgi:hypothetical protein